MNMNTHDLSLFIFTTRVLSVFTTRTDSYIYIYIFAISDYIRLYPTISNYIRLYLIYPTISHHIGIGISQRYAPGGGCQSTVSAGASPQRAARRRRWLAQPPSPPPQTPRTQSHSPQRANLKRECAHPQSKPGSPREHQHIPLLITVYSRGECLCVFCVGPLRGPPLRWWVFCGALPSVWVPCVGPLCGSPLWIPCVGPLCVGPLCGSPVWVPRRAAFHVASTRVMSPARSHAPA